MTPKLKANASHIRSMTRSNGRKQSVSTTDFGASTIVLPDRPVDLTASLEAIDACHLCHFFGIAAAAFLSSAATSSFRRVSASASGSNGRSEKRTPSRALFRSLPIGLW